MDPEGLVDVSDHVLQFCMLDKKVILHLREFLACVNVLVQMKKNILYRPVLVSLESAVKDASRRDIDSLIRSMKEYEKSMFSPSKFAKLAKHLSENWRQRFPIMNIHTP
jgi:hypothetical protein